MIPEHFLKDHLLIINFHHVRPGNPKEFSALHYRSVIQFEEQISLLGKYFDFISPTEAARILKSGQPPSSSKCMLTFDDGLRDHFDHVFPALQRLKLTALFCINTRPWEGKLLSVHMAHLLSAAYSY